MNRMLAVIPCLDEAENLPSLIDQFMAEDCIDILVVADGGSTDGSREIVAARSERHPRVRLLSNPDRIQSAGINRAVERYGEGREWLLRIDGHCLYPQGYAAALLGAAERHGAGSVVVPMITRGRGGFQDAAAAAQNSIIGTGGSPHRHLVSGRFVEHGHHALMRIDLFRKVGGYCEAMPCNEDAELDHRLGLAGGRIWLEPSAAITYFPRKSPAALWRQYYRYGRGRSRTLRRHCLRPAPRQLLPLAVPLSAGLALLGGLHWIFLVPFATWLVVVLGAGAVIGLKDGGGWKLLAGVAAGIMQFAWGCGFLAERLLTGSATPGRYGLGARR